VADLALIWRDDRDRVRRVFAAQFVQAVDAAMQAALFPRCAGAVATVRQMRRRGENVPSPGGIPETGGAPPAPLACARAGYAPAVQARLLLSERS
jgi:hypothetical protein